MKTEQKFSRPRSRGDFEISIICALPRELDAVLLVLDESWDGDGGQYQYGKPSRDPNTYRTGRLGQFNVVLALLPNTGTIEAAGAAAMLQSSFPNVSLALVVGVCGGMPFAQGEEIVLGDVIISNIILQYDFGRQLSDRFVTKDSIEDSLGRPNKCVRGLLGLLQTTWICDKVEDRAAVYLQQLQAKNDASSRQRRRGKYRYPGTDNDKLFKDAYEHKHHDPLWGCNTCAQGSVCDESRDFACNDLGCDSQALVHRKRLAKWDLFSRERYNDGDKSVPPLQPRIFIGRMGSGDSVIRSAQHRKILAAKGVIGFEMEGAGVWDQLPCIVVKGVCDYADSHKNKGWQDYAAATAASVAKAVLEQYTSIKTMTESRPSELSQAHNQQSLGYRGDDDSITDHSHNPGYQKVVFHGPVNGSKVISGGIHARGGTNNITL